MRRVVMTLMATVAVAGSLAACGGSSASGAAGQVQSTMKGFLNALANGNGSAACALLTPAAQSQIESQAGSSGSGAPCSAAVEGLAGELNASDKSKLTGASVIDIKVSGNHATAKIKSGTGEAKLVKTGGKWLISDGLGS